ncbi:PREDICTED: epithelial cell-transforming sequence 2 oncogene-like [Gekko japonicus]|uniref:Epithelial cell-transforming sequence 2 oncogene-like n=1 Tax=Gekko japonicus TaxID=146911 RepID=A0ABM1KDX3_GEKJA|nr:PREDICTED: epithelial cell-transforming sequence 2 oncogene-like [Gekko japonicus]
MKDKKAVGTIYEATNGCQSVIVKCEAQLLFKGTASTSIMTAANMTSALHSVKQWHLESLGATRSSPDQTTEMLHTRFSSWTPLENQSLNEQLFQERVRLISHWFDMWTDRQRKQFLHWILLKCSASQLKFVGKWFVENIPVVKVDFTSLLPRFISLYIFSFLSPKDLCAGAQVSWHWKFLTEQDCLWMPKCVRFGWFLPYSPAQNEYSAWKKHYIACATHLDGLALKEAPKTYEAVSGPQTENEEQKERMYEKWLQKVIRERLVLHKKELLKMRPPWLSGTQNSRFFKSGFRPYLSQIIHVGSPEALLLMKKRMSSNDILSEQVSKEVKSVPNFSLATEQHFVLASLKALPKRKNVAGSDSYPVLPHKHCLTVSQRYVNMAHLLQPHLVLISSQVPAYEMIVDSVKPGVIPVVYEHCGTTLESLFYYVEKELDSRTAKSIGIVSDGDSRGINLLRGCRISMKDLLNPEVREFWKKLGSCITSQQEGGYVDIFLPLAASEAGKELLSQLSGLTGAFFRTPTGIATGSYQHILSEWLGNDRDNPPPSLYFTEAKLQMWLRLTELLEDTLKTVRKQLRPYLYDLQKKMTGKIIGQIVFDAMSWSEVQDNQAIAMALTDGLTELSRGNYENPLEFLSHFLLKKHSKNKELRSQVFLTEYNPEASVGASVKNGKHQENTQEKRETLVRELLISENTYVRVLEIIRDVYTKPLKAALASNRPILSHANVQIIFSDIMDILQLNRWFLAALTQRLKEWSPAQNVGDIFIKFCQHFQTYTNFYNNYAVILKTIDQCRETIPLFRAFLKRHDKTVITGMRSLQELLLCPSKRFEEYIVLLYALKLHTPTEHTDREDLTSAIKQMHRYTDYIDQLKKNVGRDDQLLTTQRLIQGCPNVLKANRYLIRTQDVAQLYCCSEKVSAPFRLYEHIYDLSLFLFNDILVISQRSISHKPFEWSSKMTHQFLAMVALHQLFVEDIPESKYIKNAFLLQGPRLQLICSTEEADKFPWLSALQRAIICNIEENGSI